MDLSLKKQFFQLGNKAPKKELQLRFLKRLSRLLNNGYPIIEALNIIQWDKQLKLIASEITLSLKSGCTLDEALEYVHFNPVITSYLSFVRSNGDLQTSLEKCITMFEQRWQYIKKFQETLRYPLILLLIFTVLIYFVKQSILPSFLDLFANSTNGSSTVTIAIMFIDLIEKFFLTAGILIGTAFLLWHFNNGRLSVQRKIRFYSLIPIYGKYKKAQISFQFAMQVSSLLKTGMSIKEILSSMSQQQKQPILAYYASLMTSELSKGIYITNLLTNLPLIDKQLATIFQKNTDNDALEKDLRVYAEWQTEEIQRKMLKSITYIQPVFFVFLASLIIIIYMVLMMPMFQLIKTI